MSNQITKLKKKKKQNQETKTKNDKGFSLKLFKYLGYIVLGVLSIMIYFLVMQFIIVLSLSFIETTIESKALQYDPVVFVIFVASLSTVFITLFVTKVRVFKLLKQGSIKALNFAKVRTSSVSDKKEG